ncbi:MAG: NUDIX domain-containing protein [Chloroflexi bacterium]|nr:NUDIX domain-containing protein [Chloroflexota bacterium]
MNAEVVGKVTAFITRETNEVRQLLVFTHPNAGVQLPGGTMEAGETPEIAILREVQEETTLTSVEIVAHLETLDQTLTDAMFVMTEPYVLEVEPGDSGRRVAALTRGFPVQLIELDGDYAHVWYNFKLDENGRFRPDLHYTGWLPARLLTPHTRRHLFHLASTAPTPQRWSNRADFNHTFDLYWAALDVELVASQQPWLDLVRDRLRLSEKD